jgi:hypothetical protein
MLMRYDPFAAPDRLGEGLDLDRISRRGGSRSPAVGRLDGEPPPAPVPAPTFN